MGFVAFSLFNITLGLSARSETQSFFNRESLSDTRQLKLYGLALVVTFLGTELGFLQRWFNTVSLTFDQWLVCILAALSIILVEEIIKYFMRRGQSK